MMLNKDSSTEEGSFCSEVWDSLNGLDEMNKEINKEINKEMIYPNVFLKLVEKIGMLASSNDVNLTEIKDIIYNVNFNCSQWKKISLLLINYIISFKNNSNSPELLDNKNIPINSGVSRNVIDYIPLGECQKSKKTNDLDFGIDVDYYNDEKGGDLWDTGEGQLVPFEIGMKILNGKIGNNDSDIGEETKEKIKKIEDDACKLAAIRMNGSREYQRLFQEKEHWKYLAKTRLIELENEIDFRYELVFGKDKKNFM